MKRLLNSNTETHYKTLHKGKYSMKTKLFNIYLALIPVLALFLSGAIFGTHRGEDWVLSLFFLVIGLLGLKLYVHARIE